MRLTMVNDDDTIVGNWILPDTADAGDIAEALKEAFDWVDCETCGKLIKPSCAVEDGADFYCLNCCMPRRAKARGA